MPSHRDALLAGVVRLQKAGVPDAARDARILLAFALDVDIAKLMLVDTDPISPESSAAFEAAIVLREMRKPVSQILGRREFYGRSFIIDGSVLDPRPETETLIEVALRLPFSRVLDMGVGSGAILVTLLAENANSRGVGIDTNEDAIRLSGQNAAFHGVGDRITLPLSDWWNDVGGRYDLIVSNPPYIAANEMEELSQEVQGWEPRDALTDEGDGLSAYRAIADGANAHLVENGRLIVEIGPTQTSAVHQIFSDAGFEEITIFPDLDGRDRVVLAQN